MKINHFPSIYELESPILVTGHTGFKGSWMCLLLEELGIPYIGLSLPPTKDSLFLSAGLETSSDTYIDIRNLKAVSDYIAERNPSAVIHMAAQPLVLKSYEDPLGTFETNVIGTANLLEASFKGKSIKAFVGITTDKVYKNENLARRFTETDALEGKDPYSASKVGSESVLAAWRHISGVAGGPKVLSVRAGNVIGGGDLAENRIIPDLVRSVITKTTLEIRNPQSTRPWQHVLDPIYGYLLALEKTLSNPNSEFLTFNFGPSDESLEVTKVIEGFKEEFGDQIDVTYPEISNSRLESKLLDLDSSLATRILGWTPKWNQTEAIHLTADWWKKVLNNEVRPKQACKRDIMEFLSEHEV